ADDAADRTEAARDQEPHRHRGGVPAARRQAAEDRPAGAGLVEMKGLRIEFGGEGFDALRLDPQRRRGEGLTRCEIFKIAFGHDGSRHSIGAGSSSLTGAVTTMKVKGVRPVL